MCSLTYYRCHLKPSILHIPVHKTLSTTFCSLKSTDDPVLIGKTFRSANRNDTHSLNSLNSFALYTTPPFSCGQSDDGWLLLLLIIFQTYFHHLNVQQPVVELSSYTLCTVEHNTATADMPPTGHIKDSSNRPAVTQLHKKHCLCFSFFVRHRRHTVVNKLIRCYVDDGVL